MQLGAEGGWDPHSGNRVKRLRQRFLSQDALAEPGVWGNRSRSVPSCSLYFSQFFITADSDFSFEASEKIPNALY